MVSSLGLTSATAILGAFENGDIEAALERFGTGGDFRSDSHALALGQPGQTWALGEGRRFGACLALLTSS